MILLSYEIWLLNYDLTITFVKSKLSRGLPIIWQHRRRTERADKEAGKEVEVDRGVEDGARA